MGFKDLLEKPLEQWKHLNKLKIEGNATKHNITHMKYFICFQHLT